MDILWVGVAFIFGSLVARVQIPPLVGYLLAGITLSLYNYEPGGMLHEIAHLGIIFLLFTVGLHLRLKNIIRVEVFGVGLLHLVVMTGIFIPVCMIFGFELLSATILSITLAFSSTVLTAKKLEIRNEMGAFYGRIAIGILIIQDIVAIVIIAYTGGGTPSPWSFLLLLLPLTRPLLFGLLNLLKEAELIMLFAIVLAIGGASLFEWVGLNGELGALVFGMLLASDPRAEDLGKKMWSLKEAFLVGFFFEVGLTGIPSFEDIYLITAFLLLLPLKSILFYGLFMVFKLRARTGFLTTLSLTAYSEFTLIAGVVAASNGFITESTVVMLGILTAFSFLINSAVSSREEILWKKLEPFLLHFEREGKHPDKQTVSLGAAEYLVVGMGSAGRTAYDTLREGKKQVVGMEIDPDRIEQNLKAGRRVVYGDIQDTDLWNNINLENIKSIMIAMGNQEAKINATRTIHEIWNNLPVYAITMREDESKALEKAGAYPVSIPIKEAGQRLAELSMNSNASESNQQ